MDTRMISALVAVGAAGIVAACVGPRIGRPTAPEVRTLLVAATTDVHGRLRGYDYYRGHPEPGYGLARVKTIVDSLRRANPRGVVLVDAGDLLQGNPLTYVASRQQAGTIHPVIAAMNAVGYDAFAIGNHEFNYGVPLLDRALVDAQFAALAANVVTTSGRPAYRSWVMLDRGGVRVAVVGATTPGSMIWDRDNLRGRLVVTDIVPAVSRAVRDARAAGAAVVVVVLHSGLDGSSSYDTAATGVASENVGARVAREIAGIDVVVIGHSHREIADTTIGGVLVVQPRNYAASVAVAELQLERAGGAWHVASKRGRLVRAAGHVEDPRVLAVTETAHRAAMAYAAETLGTTPVAWRGDSARVTDTPIVDFILEVQRRVAGTELSSTAAFNPRASLGPGPITVANVAALYPYENTLRAIRISGRQLRDYLEQSARYFGGDTTRVAIDTTIPGYNYDMVSGVDYVIDARKPRGARVSRLTYRGRPVVDSDTFTLALNNYRQAGGGGFAMLAGTPVLYESKEGIRDLLIAEVRRQRILRPVDYFRPNWRLDPPAAVDEALQAMHRGFP